MHHRWFTSVGAATLVCMMGLPAFGAEPADPDWPCVQRKVPELAIGQMWAGPLPDAPPTEAEALEERADALAQRRVPVEEAVAAAEDLVADLDGEERARALAFLFERILERINAERGAVIAGIGRYARSQEAQAALVEQKQLELARLEAVPDDQKDWDRIEELRDTLAWDTRVFRERAQSLAYVCETPTLLERRAFELGRALSALI